MRVKTNSCYYDEKLMWVSLYIDGIHVGRFSSESIARDYANKMIVKGKALKRSVKYIK